MQLRHTFPLLIALASCSGDPSEDGNGGSATPVPLRTLDESTCPFELDASQVLGRTVRCGFALVPEERDRPGGRTIRLPFALFLPDASGKVKPGSTVSVNLLGGPGQSWTSITKIISGIAEPLLVVEQRGVGASVPSLSCGDVDSAPPPFLFADVGAASDRYAAEVRACRNRLEGSASLGAYTTEAMADDLADVIKALRDVCAHRVRLRSSSQGSETDVDRTPKPLAARARERENASPWRTGVGASSSGS